MTHISKTDALVFPDTEAYSKEIGLSTDVLKEAYNRGIKVNGRCPIRFTVTLICKKPENR